MRPGDILIRDSNYGYEVAIATGQGQRAAVVGFTKTGSMELRLTTIETDTGIARPHSWTKACDTQWAAWKAAADAEEKLRGK